jgi:hypothetical protein
MALPCRGSLAARVRGATRAAAPSRNFHLAETCRGPEHRSSQPGSGRGAWPGRAGAVRRPGPGRRGPRRHRLHARRGQRRAGPRLHAAVDALRPDRRRQQPTARGRGGARPGVHEGDLGRRRPHRRLSRLDRQDHGRRAEAGRRLLVPVRGARREQVPGRPHQDPARGRRRPLQAGRVLLFEPAGRLVQRLWPRGRAARPGSVAAHRRLYLRVRSRLDPRGRLGRRTVAGAGERDPDDHGLSPALRLLSRRSRPAAPAPDGPDDRLLG